jgi:hypothetical protein
VHAADEPDDGVDDFARRVADETTKVMAALMADPRGVSPSALGNCLALLDGPEASVLVGELELEGHRNLLVCYLSGNRICCLQLLPYVRTIPDNKAVVVGASIGCCLGFICAGLLAAGRES